MVRQINTHKLTAANWAIIYILAAVCFVFEWLGEASFSCASWGREVMLLLKCTEHSLDSAVIVCDDEGRWST